MTSKLRPPDRISHTNDDITNTAIAVMDVMRRSGTWDRGAAIFCAGLLARFGVDIASVVDDDLPFLDEPDEPVDDDSGQFVVLPEPVKVLPARSSMIDL